MGFQEFSKNYLDILMIPLFQHLLCIVSYMPWYFSFRFNKIISLSAGKSIILSVAPKAGSSL